MRILNKKQKKLLDSVLKNNPDIYMFVQLPIKAIEKLESINDHETLCQNINRYIVDYRFKENN